MTRSCTIRLKLQSCRRTKCFLHFVLAISFFEPPLRPALHHEDLPNLFSWLSPALLTRSCTSKLSTTCLWHPTFRIASLKSHIFTGINQKILHIKAFDLPSSSRLPCKSSNCQFDSIHLYQNQPKNSAYQGIWFAVIISIAIQILKLSIRHHTSLSEPIERFSLSKAFDLPSSSQLPTNLSNCRFDIVHLYQNSQKVSALRRLLICRHHFNCHPISRAITLRARTLIRILHITVFDLPSSFKCHFISRTANSRPCFFIKISRKPLNIRACDLHSHLLSAIFLELPFRSRHTISWTRDLPSRSNQWRDLTNQAFWFVIMLIICHFSRTINSISSYRFLDSISSYPDQHHDKILETFWSAIILSIYHLSNCQFDLVILLLELRIFISIRIHDEILHN